MKCTAEEARGFARACEEFANGVDDTFYRDAFAKAAEIITALCGELSTEKVINSPSEQSVKEREEGKERHSPQTPYREKGKKGKKTPAPSHRACARTCEECSYVGPVWDDVLRYATHQKVNIDPDYALWWYGQMDALGWCNPDCIGEPIGNWRSMLRTWWKHRGKDGSDWKKAVAAKPRKYSAAEWALCSERCGHFDAQACRCRVGCCVPPDLRPTPFPPEECARFSRKEAR